MMNAGKTSGKRSFNPPPIISHAPQGFAGAPGPTEEELRRARFLVLSPLAAGFLLLLLVLWIEHVRCSGATDSTNETACSSDSSSGSGGGGGGGSGGSGGGGGGAARFGGFGAVGAGHGGGGG